VLLKPEFFAINTLEATHELPINNEIILKEVKAALLLDKVTKDYNLSSARHLGQWKTYELVSRNYWWPRMTTFIKKYVTGCDMCQQIKNHPQ